MEEPGYTVWLEFVGSIKQRKRFAAGAVVTRDENKAVMCALLESANDAPYEQSWRAAEWLIEKLAAKKYPITIITQDYELASVVEAAKEGSVVGVGPLQKFYDRVRTHPEIQVKFSKATPDFDHYITAFRAASEALTAAGIR